MKKFYVCTAEKILNTAMHFGAGLLLLGCASTRQAHDAPSLDLAALQEIDVKTSAMSIETDFMTVPFEGQIVFQPARPAGVAATPIQVFRQDPRRGEPYPVSIAIDQEGRFAEQVRLLVCRSGKDEWPHWPTFIFKVPGCEEQRITLDAGAGSRRVKMSCSGQQ